MSKDEVYVGGCEHSLLLGRLSKHFMTTLKGLSNYARVMGSFDIRKIGLQLTNKARKISGD